jgi:Trypsin
LATVGLVRRSLLAAILAVAVIPAAAASAQTRIISGSNANMGAFPYQVLLRISLPNVGLVGCGGSVKDATHVITAAHCVEGETARGYPLITSGSGITIKHGGVDQGGGTSGTGDDLQTYSGTVTRVSVDRRRQRRLFGDEYDTALLTLSSSILGPNTDDIALATPSDLTGSFGFGAADDNKPFISGWGRTTPGSGLGSVLLQYAQVGLVPDSGVGLSCDDEYGPDELIKPVMLCAGGRTGSGLVEDTCQGDSGGPLALDSVNGPNGPGNGPGSGGKLAGITSFGHGCGQPGVPGVYTEVTEPGTTSFLNSSPPSAPVVLGAPHVAGTPRVGSTVTCVPPSLPTGVVVNQYLWYAVSGGGFNLFAAGTSPNVVLPAATQGLTVGCDVRVENGGGYRYLEFVSTIGPVGAAVTPTPTPPPPPADTTKPRVRVQKVRCKRRRCRITIKATDQGGLVKRVSARVRGKYKKCRRVGGRRRCTTKRANKRLRLRKLKGGIYRGRIKLRRGRYAAYAVATDAAGNRSRRAKKTFRVR